MLVLREHKLTAEAAASEAEINLAALIQLDVLPGVSPAFSSRTDFDLFAAMTPAKGASG